MNLAVDIIKHDGKRPTEQFVRDKLYDSIVKTCLSVHTPEGQAEDIADTVCDLVTVWLQKRPEVTSSDIRIATTRHLTNYHPEAAYLYEQHSITI